MKTISTILDLVGYVAVSAYETLFLGKSAAQQMEDGA